MDDSPHNTRSHKTNSSTYTHEGSSPTDLFSSAQVLAGAAMSTYRHEPSKLNKSEAAAAADNVLHAISQYGHLEEKSYGKYIGKAEEYLHQYATPSSQLPSHGSGPAKKHQVEEEYDDEENEEEHHTGHKPSVRPPSYNSGKVKKHQEEDYEEEEEEYTSHRPSARPPSYGSGKVKKHQEEEYEEEEEEEYTSHKPSAQPPSYGTGKVKKHHEEEEEGEGLGGGVGDYMKLAQGLLKSHGGGHSGNSASSESDAAGIGDYMKLAQGFLGKR